MTPLIYGISYRATSPARRIRKMYMGIFALLYYIIMGDTVRTVEDWQRRRTEIKDRWMSLLGQWPPVITGQTFEILDTLHRENFMQYRVRFYWTPNEQTEGYLLVPTKKAKSLPLSLPFYEPETAIGLGGKPYRDFAYQLTKKRICHIINRNNEDHRESDIFHLLPHH